MKTREPQITLTANTSGSASTTTAASAGSSGYAGAGVLSRCEGLTVDATIVGPTGGTVDVYIQRKLATNSWVDWVHFPQVAAATTKRYTFTVVGDGSTITEVGGGTDASPGVALAANTVVNVTPGGDLRIVTVTGAGVSVAGTVTLVLTPYTERFG